MADRNLTLALQGEDRQTIGDMVYGFKNVLINGDFRINQRGAASPTAIVGAYNYDRMYYDGTNLIQRVESGNYKVSTTYTLSGTNVTTTQITSPSSGTWTITFPSNADKVQLEEGSVATPFEQRPIGLELSLCQRYYWRGTFRPSIGAKYGVANSVLLANAIPLPLNMRSTKSLTIDESNTTYDNCSAQAIVVGASGIMERVTITANGAFRVIGTVYSVDAEIY